MKRIVIMGATSGIGLAVAERLASKGHKVGVAGRKTSVLKRLQKTFPTQIEWEEIDITDSDATKRLAELIKKLGGMDTYFHVAGVGFENSALRPEEELQTVQTNVVGFVRMIDYAFAYFRDAKQPGHIAAITSVAGTRGIGELASYSASKSFGQAYLEALDQLARIQNLRIKFTDVRPGWIRTPLLNPAQEYPMTMSLNYAAPRIISSMGSCGRIHYIDWRWGILARLMKVVPSCLWVRLPLQVFTRASFRQMLANERATIAAEQVKVPKTDKKAPKENKNQK